jgi:predicted O-methyltransferase YrrM
MSSLTEPNVAWLLDRLFAEAERNDPPLIAQARAHRTESGDLNDRAAMAVLKEAYIPISAVTGRLLYMLVRSRRPRLVVEFGTSFGISAIHLAAALRDNGPLGDGKMGRLVTTELEPGKAKRARANLEAAGLSDLVEIRLGDAFETLKQGLDGGIELLLLDGWKDLYLPLLRFVEPQLAPDALLVADDIRLMPDILAPYLAYVRDPANGYLSVELPIDDGLELSLRAQGESGR